MNYRHYPLSKAEEIIIKRWFQIYIKDNSDIDFEGLSQPELDHEYLIFKTGWVMAMAFIT